MRVGKNQTRRMECLNNFSSHLRKEAVDLIVKFHVTIFKKWIKGGKPAHSVPRKFWRRKLRQKES